MRSVLFVLWMTSSLISAAQDCTPEALLKRPGVWKAGMSGSIHGISPKDLVRERATLASIHKMIQAKSKPEGCQFLYTNAFTGFMPGTGKNWIADFYDYTIYVLPYLCDPASSDKTKSYTAIATATILNINVNILSSLSAMYAAELPDDEFRGYLKLATRPVWNDGYYLMSDRVTDAYDPKHISKETSILITYNDTLPFSYLSRKEYLALTKKRLEKTIHDNSSSKEYYNKYMNAINSWLQKPETELSKAAVCMWNDEEQFTGFVEEGTKGSFLAVKPNPAYYRKGLPRSTPQFINVLFRVTEGYPVMTINMDSIRKAVDLAALRNMLGVAPANGASTTGKAKRTVLTNKTHKPV